MITMTNEYYSELIGNGTINIIRGKLFVTQMISNNEDLAFLIVFGMIVAFSILWVCFFDGCKCYSRADLFDNEIRTLFERYEKSKWEKRGYKSQ